MMQLRPFNDTSTLSIRAKEARQSLKLLVEETAQALAYRIAGGLNLIQEDEGKNLWIIGDSHEVQKNLVNLVNSVASERVDKLRKISVKTGIMNSDSECLKDCRVRQALGEGNYAFLEVKSSGGEINDKASPKAFHPFIKINGFAGYCLADPAIPGVAEIYHGVLHFVVSGSRENTLFRMLIPIGQNR